MKRDLPETVNLRFELPILDNGLGKFGIIDESALWILPIPSPGNDRAQGVGVRV